MYPVRRHRLSSRCIEHRGIALCLVVFALAANAGCTTVYESETTGDSWRVPRSFDRVDDAEDERVLFALRDHRREQTATVERLGFAVADPLLPALLGSHVDAELDPDIDPVDAPAGWKAAVDGDDTWTRIYTGSGTDATYLLTLKGDSAWDDKDRRFEELLDGFSFGDPPQTSDELPEVALSDGLGAPAQRQLEPVDADGNPRTATIRQFAVRRLLSDGSVLQEPLPYRIDADQYVDNALERLDIREASDFETDRSRRDFRVVSWTDEEVDEIHLLAAAVDGRRAYQLRLRFPEAAADRLEQRHRDWIGEFFGDPGALFSRIDGGAQ